MHRHLKSGLVVVAAATVFAAGGATSATAAKLITGHDIKNGTVTSADVKDLSLGLRDFGPGVQNRILNPHGKTGATGATGATGQKGEKGEKGEKGDSGLAGAYYAVAFYDSGDTNAGAIATVACKAQTDVAIAGGVQVTGLDEGANARNTPVSSSFPGRMDWSTNAPRADRLDGWIVQFGGNAGATSDKSPEKTKIWALCVPGAGIPVEQTYTQSAG
jgi:hypothetical protein